MPSFARELRKTFAGELPNAVDRADAEFNRFSNAVFDLKVAFGTELLPTLVEAAKFMTETLIPATKELGVQLGLVDFNINEASQGRIRQREGELVKQLVSIDRAQFSTTAGSDRFDALSGERHAVESQLFALREQIRLLDERNERIVKFGRTAVEAEEAAANAALKTSAAVAEVSKEYEKERVKLLERLATVEDNTESTRVLFEITEGGLKNITAAEKEELKILAERLDIERDTAEVREFMRDEELKRQRQFEQEKKRQHEATLRENERQVRDALREQERLAERQAEILAEPFKNALSNIQDTFTNTFESIFRGQIDSFGDFAGAIKDIFIRLAAEIATLMVFRPVVSGILGAGAAGGIASASGGTSSLSATLIGALAAGGSSGGIGVGTSAGLGASLVNGLQSPLGASLGIGLADKLGLGAFGQSAFAGAGLNAPFGLIGSLGANLLGLGGGVGGSIGGTLGGLAGGGLGAALLPAFSAAGPIGAVAGGLLGTVFGGLFGGAPKRQTGLATFSPSTGRLLSQGGKGDSGAGAASLAGQLTSKVREAADLIGAEIRPFALSIRDFQNAGTFGASPLQVIFRNKELSFNDANSAIQQGGLAFLRFNEKVPGGANITGVDPEFKSALAQAGTLDQLIQMARTIKQNTEAQKAQTEAIQASKGDPAALNISLGALLLQRRSALGIPGLESFQRNLSFGGLSPFSSVEKFRRGRAELDSLSGAALGGDPEALRAFPQLAQQVLGLGRDAFASGPQFAEVFTSVNTTLNQVLDRQRELEEGLLVGLEFTIRDATNDQINALERTIALVVTELKGLRGDIKRAA